MNNLPLYIAPVFSLVTILTVLLFLRANSSQSKVSMILFGWLLIQGIISLTGFYTITHTLPPRFLLLILPPFTGILLLFITKSGRAYIDSLNTKYLTLLHIVRIPVEIVLYWLFLQKTIPELMTFEGRNFDIFSGISAPFIYYFGFVKKQLGRKVILFWNIVCLGLLINIVVNAILSAPFPFQQFAFDQPNIAVLYFPFVWLPCCVVPLVLFSHLVCMRQLIKNN